MEDSAIVIRLVVLHLVGLRIGPVLATGGQGDEVGDGLGCLTLIELSGDAAH